MSCGIYKAINLVSGEIALLGVPKSRTNSRDNYQYRSIDDVLERLAPILAKHKLCLLPRVLERTVIERQSDQNLLISVTLKVAFDMVSAEDGSKHTIEAYGEALDAGDKATAKAMSSAYKTAMIQTFCIPVSGNGDPDRSTHRLKASPYLEPVEGWPDWSEGITQTIAICESQEALDRFQKTHRSGLTSLKREQPDLYATIGAAFTTRAKELRPNSDAASNESHLAARVTKRPGRARVLRGKSGQGMPVGE